MIDRETLAAYIDDLLACKNYRDYAPNGLQIEGKSRIKNLCTAVSVSDEVISTAIQQHADALLVHHGFFWRGEETILRGIKRQRIAKLIQGDMNLFAYHLPLDGHRELGNNACLARLLGITECQSYAVKEQPHLLWKGSLAEKMSVKNFYQMLEEKFQRAPLHIASSKKEIQQVAWCTGAAQDFIEEAYSLQVDAFLSGEISERTYYLAKEYDIHYFACGHHATERYGIQSLGEHLSEKFGISHAFIDSDNPI